MPNLAGHRPTTRISTLILTMLLTIAACVIWIPRATAASRPGCDAVHVGPEIAPGAAPASYLSVTVKPGATAQAGLIVANPEPYSCGVTLLGAYGKTAINSGDTYPVASGACATTSCWLSGLPAKVTVGPRRRVVVPFSLMVPERTPSGDYLAGVVAGPSAPPTVRTVASGRAEVGAAVVAHVAIGVAIRIPGPLKPELTIPWVRFDRNAPIDVLNITERDGGNTWEHPRGRVLVTTEGTRHSYPIQSRTVLPRDAATLPVVITAVPHGTWPTEVDLRYDHNRKLAVWRGMIGYPKPSTATVPGSPVGPVRSGLPQWEILVIAFLGGLSGVLAGMLPIALSKRRRRAYKG